MALQKDSPSSIDHKRYGTDVNMGFKECVRNCGRETLENVRFNGKKKGTYHRKVVPGSLARPGRKQATATKLLQGTKKKNGEGCPSNQVSAAAMTSTMDEKLRPFNCFFSPVGLRTYQHPCKGGSEVTVRGIETCSMDVLSLVFR